MKKIFSATFAFFVFCAAAFCDGIKIYAPVAQGMLIDGKNYVRYSPLNMFDADSATVFAVTYSDINPKEPLVEIYFAEPAAFDSLSIKAGYFDARYYDKNDRIRTMTVQIWNCGNKDYEATVALRDEQKEQTLYAGKKIIATKLTLYAPAVYAGSKWNDLVISDLVFYLGGKAQPVSFGEGKCVRGEFYHLYEYDRQSRLIKEFMQYGHAGSKTLYYKYDGENIYRATVDMDDDPNNPRYVPIERLPEIPEKSDGKKFYSVAGRVVAESFSEGASFYIGQYLYDKAGRLSYIVRISESKDYAHKIVGYTYDENGLLAKEVGYEDATIYTKRYE